MNVSYQWLSEYIDVSGVSASDLAERLTRGGIEVDGVASRNQGVQHVVVGYVTAKAKHPDADKLNVCQVDIGAQEPLQIVCGASNVAAGQKVPVALVGARLPGDLHIKRAKLRGVESQGMICSAKELGLNDKLLPKELQEGILVLPADTPVGLDAVKLLGIDDEVLDLDLTPNRSDCLSMIGAAYEVGALLDRPVQLPATLVVADATEAPIQIDIAAEQDCKHYAAMWIEDVVIAPAPLWMQNRLMAAGIRPINNVVDITNFVMLEVGQPLHAFDADALADGGRRIVVRHAQANERLTTLDGQDRRLEPHMLVIADGVQPIALAGVMGGANTEVTPGTRRIVLESARFSGQSVRRTSRELGLRSEASLRFEKEVNPVGVEHALLRAAALLCQYAGGKVNGGVAQVILDQPAPRVLPITASRVNAYLGTDLSKAEIERLFERLGFVVTAHNAGDAGALGASDILQVTVPLRRGDITRDVDLIEEIARLYGYDHIPTTLLSGTTTPGSLSKEQRVARVLRRALTQAGFHEAVTYSLTAPERANQLADGFASNHRIGLAMPMSEERSVLRTSLLPHLLEAVAYNRNRNTDDVALFEMGNIFLTNEEKLTQLPREQKMIAAVLTGAKTQSHWSSAQQQALTRRVDYFDLKGTLELMLSHVGIGNAQYVAAEHRGFHPGRTADIWITAASGARERLGWIGQLHPQTQTALELEDTYVFELDMVLLAQAAQLQADYTMLARYPASSRDIAVVVDAHIPAVALETTIIAAVRGLQSQGIVLESLNIFDIYTGEKLGQGKKSIAFALVYRHGERTLTDQEVNEAQAAVIQALAQQHGAQLRMS